VTDVVTPATRSRIMSRVRAKNTKPEIALRQALWAAGLRGWRCHVRDVPGTPDIAWRVRRVVVFVDSAWWHSHPSRWQPGRLPGNWDKKIQSNRERDERVNAQLREGGWTVVRIWDFELRRDLAGCVERVETAIYAG
jgi:DNA mismatch endonuclease (patch repair protein)